MKQLNSSGNMRKNLPLYHSEISTLVGIEAGDYAGMQRLVEYIEKLGRLDFKGNDGRNTIENDIDLVTGFIAIIEEV